MIPKLIHQTAKTQEIPANCRPYQQKLKALHPDWTYRLWTDEDNLALVKGQMPEFLDVYQKLPRNIMRADVIRYVLMYKLGGLYLDTDYEMLKPFDLMNYDVVLPRETDGELGEGNDRVANSIFASIPGHPFWKMVLDDLMTNPPLLPETDVLAATGPMFVTRIYQQARDAGMDIHTPVRAMFNPPTPRGPRQYKAILKSDSYGIHHCYGSWRDYTMKQKLRNTAWRIIRRFI